MYDDAEPGQDRVSGGRGALIVASLAVVVLLGAAAGYVLFVPADRQELAEYGRVEVPLNARTVKQLPAREEGGASAGGGSETAGAGRSEPGTGDAAGAGEDGDDSGATAAGTQVITGSGAGQTATAQATGAAGQAGAAEADGETGSGAPADSAAGDEQSAQTAQDGDAAGTAGDGAGDGAGTQTARVPETPAAPERDGGVSGESAITGGGEGTPQWQKYARELSPPEGVDRIAVVVRGLGLSSAATEAAIQRLPGEISLSFSPYARRSAEWSLRARARGHEVLVDLPMEPRSFPADDPGPKALMTTTPTPQNLERLAWVLGKGREIVGVVAQMGSAFVDNKRAFGPVARRLKQRGLIFVDNGDVADNAARSAAEDLSLPFAVNDRTLDEGQVSRPAIRGRLAEAERIAKQAGSAVVLAHPYPVTIDLLQDWSRKVGQRGLALVPITNIVRTPGRTEAAQLR